MRCIKFSSWVGKNVDYMENLGFFPGLKFHFGLAKPVEFSAYNSNVILKKKNFVAKNNFSEVTKSGGNDRTVTPSFSYLLNKVNDPSLPYSHYFFLMFHYCSCLISVIVSLQTTLALVVTPIRTIVTLSMKQGYRRIVRRYPNS